MVKRLHYLDWLRVIAILTLFPFHSARVFDVFDPFYAKSEHLSAFLSWSVVAWLSVWQMPLFFLVAGMSAYFSVSRRTGGAFMRERALRLMVPFAFGVLVLMPPQSWYGAQTNAGFTGSFAEYLTGGSALNPSYLLTRGDYFGGIGIGQMWFVLYLFVISALALPLFLWMRPGHRGAPFAEKASRLLATPAWWWLPAMLLLLMKPMPELGGKNLLYFLMLVVLGYIAMAGEGFSAQAKQHWKLAVAVGFALSVAVLAIASRALAFGDFAPQRIAWEYASQMATWILLVGFVGGAAALLDRRTPALEYLSEAGYPLYLLHQTVIVAVAFYLVRVPFGWPVQYALVLAAGTVITFALYEGVRRVNALRWLFGMKPHVAPAPAERPAAAEPVAQ